jgi:integrase/recombinase XerD
MSNAGIPLRIIQEISGHRTLDELYKYLEVKPEQIKGAIASLSMLTPVEGTNFDKTAYVEIETSSPDLRLNPFSESSSTRGDQP